MVSVAISAAGEFGEKVRERLATQTLAWFTTVASDGTPQPNPVWFIDDGDDIVIFSRPGQAKLANIRRNPPVSLNLEATADEEHVTIFTGTANIVDRDSIDPALLDRYAARYAKGMIGIKMTRDEYEAAYTEIIRFTPTKVRGW